MVNQNLIFSQSEGGKGGGGGGGGGKGVIVWYVNERWKYEIKTRELWLVCLSWYVNFKIFYPIFLIFN